METSRAKIVSRLRGEGWVLERHGAAHDLYVHPANPEVISVPRHKKVSIGVARSIAKAAGWRP